MILRSVRVGGWRGFLDEVSIGPLSEGLNVIHAPNGSGKSTLFEALCRGLLDNHNVGGQEIHAIKPWGRALSPSVTVEFCHKGTEYRIAKQFMDGAHSELSRKEDGAYRPLASDRNADNQVREWLTRSPPGRGLSQQKNWGLAQALWAPQGELALPELSGDLVSDIRETLGAQVSGETTGAIEKRIEELYNQYFTSTGKLRSGTAAPELVQLQERLEKAKQERAERYDRLVEYEEASRKVEDLRARRIQARLDEEELNKTIQQSRKRADTYRDLRAEAEKKKAAAETAEAQHTQVNQHINQIKAIEKELAEARETLQTLSDEAPVKQREVELRGKELTDAKATLENLQQERRTAEHTVQEADTARRYMDTLHKIENLGKRIERIEAAEKELEAANTARINHVAPDRNTLHELRQAEAARAEAQAHIDASLIVLEIVPEKSGHLNIIAGEETGKRVLAAGAPMEVKGSPRVVADLEGVARLRASGPSGDIDEYRTKLQQAQERIQELTAAYGTTDINILETRREKADELDARLNQAKKDLQTILDGDTIDELKRERAEQQAILTQLRQDRPDWEQTPPNPEELAERAGKLKRTAEERLAQAEADRDKAQTALSQANDQATNCNTRLAEAQKNVSRLQQRLADLTHDGKSLEQWEKERQSRLMEWDAAKTNMKDLHERLAAYEDDPMAVLEKLENQRMAAQEASNEARDAEKTAEGRLESLATQAPYTSYAAAEEEVASLEEDVQRKQLRADAIKLLHETIGVCRSEAVSEVAQPVEQAATDLLKRIAGRRIGRIQINEAFNPVRVRPDIMEETVNIENLSGGEREQLYFATRLALAEVLAREERQLVVLDDVLTATDTGRFARLLNILEETAQRLQIVILTCHPERFRALTDAEFFDLEEAVAP